MTPRNLAPGSRSVKACGDSSHRYCRFDRTTGRYEIALDSGREEGELADIADVVLVCIDGEDPMWTVELELAGGRRLSAEQGSSSDPAPHRAVQRTIAELLGSRRR